VSLLESDLLAGRRIFDRQGPAQPQFAPMCPCYIAITVINDLSGTAGVISPKPDLMMILL
jgi:hypothetical protein